MSGQASLRDKKLNFSGPHIAATCVENASGYYIQNRTIVINPTTSAAYVDEPPSNVIAPFSSTILKDTYIAEASTLILLELTDPINLGNIILEQGWALYGDLIATLPPAPPSDDIPYPANTPLWRSPQDSIGLIRFDPYATNYQKGRLHVPETFEIKVNLWFAPANTNCFIHNKHDFIEIHSQVVGLGRMQKFKAQSYETLYEDIQMSPGYTTTVPFCAIEGRTNFVYPWHQYYADTDCIWLAIEYHPHIAAE